MLSMQGMPAVYFHSLVGTGNDQDGVRESGQNRRINRHKYERAELESALSDPHSLQRRIFDGYRRLLEVRREQPAFHPDAALAVIDLPSNGLLGFTRATETGQRLAVLANLSVEPRMVDASLIEADLRYDELAQQRLWSNEAIEMRPFQVRWLTAN